MRYTDTDFDQTYLTVAVARIAEGLTLATDIPAQIEIPEQEILLAENSVWIVYVTGMVNNDDSSDSAVQTWSVSSQFIYKRMETTYDGTRYTNAYEVAPIAHNYMQSHKRLINTAVQSAVPYLRPTQVAVSLGDINSGGQAGFTITHRLPFHIGLEQEF
jgi:hypothetical protein